VSWPRHHPKAFAKFLWNGFFRLAAVLSVGYLVYDRLYETAATLSAPSSSDPNDPFVFPFSITNNSHIFRITDVNWTCTVASLHTPTTTLENVGVAQSGHTSQIERGKTTNFRCAIGLFPAGPKAAGAVKEAELFVTFSYKTDFFGLFEFPSDPQSTRFRWYGEASNPQWIKGDDLR
jgi:hypothetical protein